ncbi:MAG: MotA/TolQ/ExbB proton channel family protein [Isosphaeraceae bacterium]
MNETKPGGRLRRGAEKVLSGPGVRAAALLLFMALVLLPSAAFGQDGEAAADGPKVEAAESFLHWMWRASGPIGLVIAAMSFYLVALVVWMTFQYRRSVVAPAELVRDVGDLLNQRRFSEAYQRLLVDGSFLARVVAAGVRKLPSGQASALRAMELANDDATMEMEHRTTYLATVGTLGPMIGLVGTVYGMILSFRVIATAGSSPQASQLAAGISTALFATLEGIALSIPAIYFYALFRNRIARLSLEVALSAESLLEQFAPGVRSSSMHPLAAAAVPATVPAGAGAGAYPGSPPTARPGLPPAESPEG